MATVATSQRKKTGNETTSSMHWVGGVLRRVTYRHHRSEGQSYWIAEVGLNRAYQDRTGKGSSKKRALRDLKSKVKK